jgi:hypothetical protein
MNPEHLIPQLKSAEKVIPDYIGLHNHPFPDPRSFEKLFFALEVKTCSIQMLVFLVDL